LDTITGIGSTSGFPAEELIEEEMVSVPDVPSSDLEAINDPDSTEEYLNESDTQILFEDQALESNEKNHEDAEKPTIENMIDEIEVKETTKGFTPAQNNDCESDEANAVELMKQGSKEIDGADFSSGEDFTEELPDHIYPKEPLIELDIMEAPAGIKKFTDETSDIDVIGQENVPYDHVEDITERSEESFGIVSRENGKDRPVKVREAKRLWYPYKSRIYIPDPHVDDEKKVDEFLENLKNDNLETIFSYDIKFLDYLFFRALERCDFVGDLPLSESAYRGLIAYLQLHTTEKGKRNPRLSLPTIFVVSMVFCARYSETEAREFWKPFAEQVWDTEPSKYFQNICRELFVYSREFLHQNIGMKFLFNRYGEVVRPIYQHAIIPNHLQIYFSDWLVENYENLLEYPSETLETILQNEQSLNYVPRSLKNFILGNDTKETAARLIYLMSNALALFFQEEQTEAVESLFSSSIEKTIWETIYKKLMSIPNKLEKSRKTFPRLQWIWDLEKDEVILKLSNMRSDKNSKPDSVTVAEKNSECLKSNQILFKVFPWKLKSGNWELDTILIPVEPGYDGDVLVLSENFDLDNNRLSQSEHIIFERTVPPLDDPILIFEENKNKKLASKKEIIDFNGDWIIVGKAGFSVLDRDGKELTGSPISVPFQLLKIGYFHAKKYNVDRPISIQYENETKSFDKKAPRNVIDPIIVGDVKVPGLSTEVPQVFSSDEVEFRFTLDSDVYPLHRTWLTIRYGGEFLKSVLLADLIKQGKMHVSDKLYSVDLSTYIKEAGAYELDLIHNMRRLLAEKLQFAWLPEEIKIKGPSENICYSPENPLQLSILGANESQIITDRDEKVKLTASENGITLDWRTLKKDHCGFNLIWNDSHIQFIWKIDRVFAWVEGGGDKNQVYENQASNVVLIARGKANENFYWKVGESAKTRSSSLDAKGLYSAKLNETEVRDMLLEDDTIRTTVSISMRDYQWKLFDYEKTPSIEIVGVRYEDSSLFLSIANGRKLFGDYTIQVRENSLHTRAQILDTPDSIEEKYIFPVDLIPGTYKVEILANNSVIATSSDFLVEEDRKEEKIEIFSITEEVGSPEYIFKVLTATKQQIVNIQSDCSTISAVLGQLKKIHDPDEWLVDGELRDSFKRLLPAWAVLKHPLRFITNKHKRVLHVFPEKAIYGGKAGSGYLDLKLEGEKIRIVADWKPKPDSENSWIWIRIPTVENIKYFSELSESEQLDLWPAYQCVDCGEIVGSRNGSYLQLPPSTYRLHQHGKNRDLREQFFDTVYRHGKDETVDVSITQYDRELLRYTFLPKDIIHPKYLHFLITGKAIAKPGNLSQPIETRDSRDFGIAIDNLYENLKNSYLRAFSDYVKDLLRVYDCLLDGIERHPAFGPFERLMSNLYEPIYPYNLPSSILTLSMLLRLKGNDAIMYENLIANLGITEESLVQMTNHLVQGSPKMLEWGIAWAELFFVHAIS
jgi:hypothetical protein